MHLEQPASVTLDVQLAATEGFNGSAKATLISENQADSVALQAEGDIV